MTSRPVNTSGQLMTSTAFGPVQSALGDRYRIERELGRGGMATVYLAHDLKHHREVALKVLLPELATMLGAERFLHEIKVVAHLQHPHILPLFDSSEVDGLVYFVMPRVEGESLRDRLQREKQLPIDDAVQITRQVAGALHYAHRRGVIHRDIKPANILLQDGQALVADFGIALAVSEAADQRLTTAGLSLGTPAYMSPEQAAGERDLDGRSDIYSLGAVLYEMLTGQPPHTGATPLATFAKTLNEPHRPVRQSRQTVPPHVDAALQTALAKLPADRFASAADFARALSEPRLASQGTGPADAASDARRAARAHHWRLVSAAGWIVAAAAAIALWRGRQLRAPEDARVRRWEIALPDSAPLALVGVATLGVGRPSLALAPDGDRLVYVARRNGTTELYQRELAKLDGALLPGTEGAYHPFFSPDGAWVAFFTGSELKKVSIVEGQVVTLAHVDQPYGATWTPDGRILVAAYGGMQPGWVPATGGSWQPIDPPPAGWWRFPQVMPDGEWVLHTGIDGALYLSSLASMQAYAVTHEGVTPRAATTESRLIFGSNPVYVETGHILYLSGGDGILMALPFDARRRRVLGPPTPLLEGIRQEAETGAGQFAIAGDGTLLYAPGANAELSVLVWIDHEGRIDTLPFPRARYGAFDLSADGRQIAIRVVPPSGRAELRVLDVERGSETRVQTRGIPTFYPRWMPDRSEILFGEFSPLGEEVAAVLRQAPTSASVPETLATAAIVTDVAPDGRHLVAVMQGAERGLWLLDADPRGERPVRLLPEGTGFPSFAPDGRWLVYTDQVQAEVFVTSTQQPGVRHRISTAGGEEPLWSRDGDRIIYRDRQRWLAVDVSTRNGFRAGKPRVLFEGPYLNVPGWSHDIAPDGERHLLLLGPQEETTRRLVVVQNWFSELRRMARSRGEDARGR